MMWWKKLSRPRAGDPANGAGLRAGEAGALRRVVSRRNVMAGLGVAAVIAGLLAFDLTYLAHGTYRPVIGDPQRYARRAMLLLESVAQRHPVVEAAIPGLAALVPQDPIDPSYVVLGLGGQGPGNPAFLALSVAAFGLDRGNPLRAMRTGEILLHLLSALLLWAVARRLGGNRFGLGVLALYALYGANTYMASQLLSENVCTPLVLLAVYAGLRLAGGVAGWRAVGFGAVLGLCLIGLALARPVYTGLAFLALGAAGAWAGGAVLRRRVGPAALVGVGAAATCFFVPYLAWQLTLVEAYHMDHLPISTAGPRQIGYKLQESYNVGADGWAWAGILQNSERYWLPQPTVGESLRDHPLASAALRVEKLYRLWRYPSDKYGNPLLLPRGVGETYHAALVLLGALGGWLLWRRRALIPVLLPVAYTTLIYTATFSDERRFAFPVMGLVIVLAAVALQWALGVVPGALAALRDRRRAAWSALWLVAAAGAGAGVFRSSAFALPGPVAPYAQYLAFLAVFALAVVVACAVVAKGFAGGGRERWAATLFLAGVLVVPPVVHLARYHDWSTWRLDLRRPGQQVFQTIRLPSEVRWEEVRAATLQVDVLDPDGLADALVVLANGRKLGSPEQNFDGTRMWVKYMGESHAPLLRGVDWTRVHAVPGMHQWLVWPLDPAAFMGRRTVTFALGLAPGATEADAMTLFGDVPAGRYGTDPGPRVWLLPELVGGPVAMPPVGRNSLRRNAMYGDMRIYGGTRLMGRSESRYLPDANDPATLRSLDAGHRDLSDAPLRQTGGFRIRLQLLTRDGRELVL